MRNRPGRIGLIFAFLLALLPAVSAQGEIAKPKLPELRAQLERLEEQKELAKSLKDELRTLYQAAEKSLREAESSRQRATEFQQKAEIPAKELANLDQELSRPPRKASLPEKLPEELEDVAKLEEKTESEREKVQRLTKELERAEADLDASSTRMPKLPSQIQKRENERDALAKALEGVVALPSTFDPASAKRWQQTARLEALNAEIAALQAELRYYEEAKEFLPKQRDVLQRRLDFQKALAELWTKKLQERRASVTDSAVGRARRQLARFREHPVLGPIAKENLELRERLVGEPGIVETWWTGLNQRLVRATSRLGEAKAELEELQKSRDSLLDKIRKFGANRAIGQLLRQRYQALPLDEDLEQEQQSVLRQIEDVQYQKYLVNERRSGEPEPVLGVENLVSEFTDLEWSDEIRANAVTLLQERRSALKELHDTLTKLESKLWDLLKPTRDERDVANQLRNFLREHVLWVRSVSGPLVPELKQLQTGFASLLDVKSFLRAMAEPLRSTSFDSPKLLGLLLLLVLLVLARRFGKVRIATVAKRVSKATTDHFGYSLVALFWGIVRAGFWPGVLFLFASYLRIPLAPGSYASGLASTLAFVATLMFPLLLLLEMARRNGLGQAHFRWSGNTCKAIRRLVRRTLPMLVASSFVAKLLGAVDGGAGHESVGRFAFIVFAITWAWLLHRVFRRGSAVLGGYYKRRPQSRLTRGAKVWEWIGIGVPGALALLALVGYQFTALLVADRLLQTLALAFAWIVVHGLLLRWLFVAKRRAALEQASAKSEAEERPADDFEPDLIALNAQTKRLFGSALIVTMLFAVLAIWSDVIPALRVLDDVELYPRFLHVDVVGDSDTDSGSESTTPARSGAAESGSGEREQQKTETGFARIPGLPSMDFGATSASTGRISLADLGVALLIFVLTVLLVRNVPALLEMILLARLPLDHGVRFAIATVTRYLIVILGTSLTLGSLGIGWAQLQWLVAALTFGLAFGLQEIFANLVSGLIILFEQPVRVGDIVTVGDVDGEVTRIRMRATTITSFERKEFLVPNKEFITGKLVNWTLSDPITRMTIRVGIAYGSDTHLATQEMLKVAREHPLVLEKPRPRALFTGFGDSTLDFQVRVFFDDLDNWPRIVHDMHTRIHEALGAAGVEIAFPQRDLHVRSAKGLEELALLMGPGSGRPPSGIEIERMGPTADGGDK